MASREGPEQAVSSKDKKEPIQPKMSPAAIAGLPFNSVVVHPLVLLSVTDHYHREAKDTRRRVIGVLLGETYQGRVDVTNSFALPFEEDPKDPMIFFLDHGYLMTMYGMHKKVSAKERIVGFYSSGPKIRRSDIHIDALFRGNKFASHPVLVIVDVRPDVTGLPTQAYASVDSLTAEMETTRTFEHVPCEVGAYEAEEVGVEHLLRDVNDPSVSSLAGELRAKAVGLVGLSSKLAEIAAYLGDVLEGALPRNNEILHHVQLVLAKLPNPGLATTRAALYEGSNDSHLVMYIAAQTRAVLALHDLLVNKQAAKAWEDEAMKPEAEKKADAAKEAAAKEREGKEKEAEKAKDKSKSK